MTAKPPPGLFVTGTNTGVGKTYVATAIARSLHSAGYRVGVYKPVLSGCATNLAAQVREKLTTSSDDDVLLWIAAGRPGELNRVCPQRFRTPLAPPLAARAEGREVDANLLRTGIEYWRNSSEIVLVEGAGGLLSPVTEDQYVAHVAADLGYPLLIVAENTLGAINQTLQTIIAAKVFQGGLPVAGVVLNQPPNASSRDNTLAESIGAENYRELTKRLTTNVTRLNLDGLEFSPHVDWLALAGVDRIVAMRCLPLELLHGKSEPPAS